MEDRKIIKTERRGRILLVTFDNPDVLNAMTNEFQDAYAALLDALETDASVDVVILTGSGKAFIAGADIKGMLKMGPKEAEAAARKIEGMYRRMERSDKVFIAAINGFALGGGTETALACDIRIASEKAKFGLPEVSLGIFPGGGGTQRLPRLIGEGKAKELIFTGRIISAAEAERLGIVNRVTGAETLLDEAVQLAEEILKNSMVGVAASKKAIYYSGSAVGEPDLAYEKSLFGMCFSQQDQKEGMTAFVEKRPPVYR
ncbi:MAG: enoyl-CoA hydratase/isomerase family protein [Clostridiales Family XIII bacterium]|jgi:enoyl-CoA hydratase|nr:enoyl-CoA hydratase/isomerase family protein [Clostridiales Family XIII bacterium]